MFIKTERLAKSYRGHKVVDEVNINVGSGEIVGLLGPNGAGKTTTFYMVVGLVKPEYGHVYLGDEDITKLPMHKRAQRGIGYLPQDESIFRKLTVEENILILWELMLNAPKTHDDREKMLSNLLSELGVTHLRKRKSYELSGGERRRVEIARALAMNPSFLLLDEPFTGIDPITVDDIQKIIKYLSTKNLGILITDHNVKETLSITDRAYIIHKGKILISGKSNDIINDETAKKLYLGEEFTL